MININRNKNVQDRRNLNLNLRLNLNLNLNLNPHVDLLLPKTLKPLDQAEPAGRLKPQTNRPEPHKTHPDHHPAE